MIPLQVCCCCSGVLWRELCWRGACGWSVYTSRSVHSPGLRRTQDQRQRYVPTT